MKITLTFDNGPEPEVTPHVLKVLRRHGILANFFVLGKKLALADGMRIVRQACDEGHLIGNHTFSHETPLGLIEDGPAAVSEIERTDLLLGSLSGNEKLFRPFGRARIGDHLLSEAVWEYLKTHEFTCALWNCIAYEYLNPDTWIEPTLQSCEERDWTVLVLHDLPNGSMAHLDRFVAELKERGATFHQDLPDSCVPLRLGREVWDPSSLMPPR